MESDTHTIVGDIEVNLIHMRHFTEHLDKNVPRRRRLRGLVRLYSREKCAEKRSHFPGKAALSTIVDEVETAPVEYRKALAAAIASHGGTKLTERMQHVYERIIKESQNDNSQQNKRRRRYFERSFHRHSNHILQVQQAPMTARRHHQRAYRARLRHQMAQASIALLIRLPKSNAPYTPLPIRSPKQNR